MKQIKIFGREIIDEKSIAQIERCTSENDIGVLTADAHYGYGHPIGGAVAYKDKISLSGVGFDIACGNKAVRTLLKLMKYNFQKLWMRFIIRFLSVLAEKIINLLIMKL
jgi:tRNA-splicing ligase RtcB